MYENYAEKFEKICGWFFTAEELENLGKADLLQTSTDCCAVCGMIFEDCVGGRLRQGCAYCIAKPVEFQNQILRFWWPYYMVGALNDMHPEVVNYYLARAVAIYCRVKGKGAWTQNPIIK